MDKLQQSYMKNISNDKNAVERSLLDFEITFAISHNSKVSKSCFIVVCTIYYHLNLISHWIGMENVKR